MSNTQSGLTAKERERNEKLKVACESGLPIDINPNAVLRILALVERLDAQLAADVVEVVRTPLTLEQIREADYHTPIYAQFRDWDVITGPYDIGEAAPSGEWTEYGVTVRWWTRYPTREECEIPW